MEWKKHSKAEQASSSDAVDGSELANEDLDSISFSVPAEGENEEARGVLVSENDEVLLESSSADKAISSVPTDTIHIYEQSALEPVGVASAVALVGSTALIRVSANNPEWWYLSLGLFFVAFTLSIISMIHFSRNREYYKSNALGVFTFLFCSIVILLIAALIIAFTL